MLSCFAQLTTTPLKPKSNEPIEIIFDAGKGNKALYGYQGKVYYHAGIITANSVDQSDWKMVKGEWGKPLDELELESLGGDKYKLVLNLQDIFNLDSSVSVQQLALVFRDAKGELVAKTDSETDFLIPLNGYVAPKQKLNELLYESRDYLGYRIQNNILQLQTTHGDISFQFYNHQVLKVNFIPEGTSIYDTSISVIGKPEHSDAIFLEDENEINWTKDQFTISITKKPLKISYFFENQLLISEELGFFEREKHVGVRFEMSGEETIYGSGERAVPLNRRGFRLDLFNRPDYNYGLNARNLNYSLPVLLSNQKYLLFIDNPQKGYFDIGESEPNILEFGAIGGEMKYFIVAGSSFSEINAAFANLVGHQPLPPRWALGNLQSRMAYRTQKELESIVDKMQEKKFPLDAVIIDFYWFGDSIKGYLGNLKWFEKNWPDPKGMIQSFKNKGVKTILITEPFVIDTSYWFEHGDTSKLFATTSKGDSYVMKDFYFGNASLLDMFKPATKDWFWEQYQKQIEIGVAGWWGDLGEPETHPEDMFHINGKAYEVHNMYAHEWASMVYNGYKKNYPHQRLFHLNRSGATGTQRYSIFPWSGDVSRSWSGFQAQMPLMLNMSLCGLGYISSDLGGFAMGEKDEELYIRWLQMGVFNPVFRPHGSGIPSEPIFFSEETQDIVRDAIKLRYRLMPYIYNAAYQNTTCGKPIVKPLFYYHLEDERFLDYSDVYYFGDQLIVAPVLKKNLSTITIELPSGIWYDFYTEDKLVGGKKQHIEVSLNRIPVYVKAGSFIPMLNDYMSTDDYPQDKLYMHYYPSDIGDTISYTLFEDDGMDALSLDTKNYQVNEFRSINTEKELIISVQKLEGPLDQNERRLEWVFHHVEEFPESVSINGEKIFVYHILQKPAVKEIDAKYDPEEKTLWINMPWDQSRFELIISK